MNANGEPVQAHRRALARLFLARAATRSEGVWAWLRAVLSAFILMRFFAIGGHEGPGGMQRAMTEVGVVAIVLAFSVWQLRNLQRRLFSRRVLLVSVTLDNAGLFAMLCTNVLWPDSSYPGILNMPDPSALYLASVGAGFRLSPLVAVLSGAFNLGSLSLLAALDGWLNSIAYDGADLSLSGAYILSAGAMGLLVAWRTRSLVHHGAEQSVRAELAQNSLAVVLSDHHDARSLISSLHINTDLLKREVDASSSSPTAQRLVCSLRSDLRQLGRAVSMVRDRAHAELVALGTSQPADVVKAVEQALDHVAARFPGVQFHSQVTPRTVAVPGGNDGLRRVLENLLANAAEGDGQQGATRVQIEFGPGAPRGFARINIHDDGPGFPDAVLRDAEAGSSTKPDSSALGLWLVKNIVHKSGGSLALENRRGGGATASVDVPLAVDR